MMPPMECICCEGKGTGVCYCPYDEDRICKRGEEYEREHDE